MLQYDLQIVGAAYLRKELLRYCLFSSTRPRRGSPFPFPLLHLVFCLDIRLWQRGGGGDVRCAEGKGVLGIARDINAFTKTEID